MFINFFSMLLLPSLSYSIDHNHKDIFLNENHIVPFFNEYLQKNNSKLNNVDDIRMSCSSEFICVAILYSFDS